MAFFWSTLIVAILLPIATSQADQKAGNKQTAFLEGLPASSGLKLRSVG